MTHTPVNVGSSVSAVDWICPFSLFRQECIERAIMKMHFACWVDYNHNHDIGCLMPFAMGKAWNERVLVLTFYWVSLYITS